MSKSIIKLKLDLNNHKSALKKSEIIASTPHTTAHKSFDKSIISKLVPKLSISSINSRESSALLTTSRKKLDSSRVLRENPQTSISKLSTSKRNSISKDQNSIKKLNDNHI